MTDAAIDAARLSPNPQDLVWALWAHSWANYQAGNLDDALRAGAESVALADQLGPHIFFFMDPAWQYGVVLVERGEHERGAQIMRTSMDRMGLDSVMPQDKTVVADMMVRSELAQGDVEAASQWADRAEAIAELLGLEWTTLHARRARASVLHAQDRATEAVPLAREAVRLAVATGSRLEEGRALLLLGKVLASAGDHDQAVVELRSAEQVLAEFGSEHWRADAERTLRRLGVRLAARSAPGSGTGSPLESLTGREREVADLVAAGHTNREIAGLLFLSEKTIETHLRNVFAKLGVSSRSAVARAVTEEAAGLPGG